MTLPRIWRKWAQQSAKRLVKAGIAHDLAKRLSEGEANARSQLACLVGLAAALEAPLGAIRSRRHGDKVSVELGFDVDPNLISRRDFQTIKPGVRSAEPDLSSASWKKTGTFI